MFIGMNPNPLSTEHSSCLAQINLFLAQRRLEIIHCGYSWPFSFLASSAKWANILANTHGLFSLRWISLCCSLYVISLHQKLLLPNPLKLHWIGFSSSSHIMCFSSFVTPKWEFGTAAGKFYVISKLYIHPQRNVKHLCLQNCLLYSSKCILLGQAYFHDDIQKEKFRLLHIKCLSWYFIESMGMKLIDAWVVGRTCVKVKAQPHECSLVVWARA